MTLQDWLNSKGKTHEQLAEELGMSREQVTRIVNGGKAGGKFIVRFWQVSKLPMETITELFSTEAQQ
jgi:transcriptional regulator with XRE-family HTH domain